MPHLLRSPDASPVPAIARREPPERAASLLADALGTAAALNRASRELQAARMARSRARFQFWAAVREQIDGLAANGP